MDPRNGDLLAMANWPRVDNNDVSEAPDYARQNRAVGFNYEPGSTFKAFTVAGALEDGEVTPETRFDLPPQIQVADRTIGESHPRGYVNLSVKEILAQSSNVGAIKIGQKLGDERFDQWVRRFGFGKKTGVDLPGEEAGQLLKVEDYSGSSIGNLPIGQGESVTPIQMASAYAAIANGGVLRPGADRADRRRRVAPGDPRAPRDLAGDRRLRAPDARGRARARRHRRRGRGAGLRPGGQDRHGEQGRRGHRGRTRSRATSRRSSASRRPTSRGCSSP